MVERRFFEFNEFDARIWSGEGSLGGPPTGRMPSASSMPADEALELRRSLGAGMGSGDDMTGNEIEDAQSRPSVMKKLPERDAKDHARGWARAEAVRLWYRSRQRWRSLVGGLPSHPTVLLRARAQAIK